MPRVGRRAHTTDTRPGKVLVLAMLANAPILVGFILAPLFLRDDPQAARGFIPYVLYLTPPLVIGSLFVFARAGEARAHRASRIGIVLDGVAMLLWLVVVVSLLMQ